MIGRMATEQAVRNFLSDLLNLSSFIGDLLSAQP